MADLRLRADGQSGPVVAWDDPATGAPLRALVTAALREPAGQLTGTPP